MVIKAALSLIRVVCFWPKAQRMEILKKEIKELTWHLIIRMHHHQKNQIKVSINFAQKISFIIVV